MFGFAFLLVRDSLLNAILLSQAGPNGPEVACLTAVCKVLGLNRAVFIIKTTVICSLGHGLDAPFLQCLVNSAFYPPWDGK